MVPRAQKERNKKKENDWTMDWYQENGMRFDTSQSTFFFFLFWFRGWLVVRVRNTVQPSPLLSSDDGALLGSAQALTHAGAGLGREETERFDSSSVLQLRQ